MALAPVRLTGNRSQQVFAATRMGLPKFVLRTAPKFRPPVGTSNVPALEQPDGIAILFASGHNGYGGR